MSPTTHPTDDTASTAAAAARSHRLVPGGAQVRFRTTHLLGLGRVAGSLRLLDGHVLVAADGTPLEVVAELDTASFDSGSRARDRAVASPRLLGSAAHPRATYRSSRVQPRPGGWLVHGTLTVKGVGAPVDLLVEAPGAGGGEHPDGTVRVRAGARVDRRRHGIAIPAALAGRFLDVDLDVAVDTRGA
ncbi:YceI family protein [Kineococcus gypseus]|uniref:YceI family protein n=1 Tax=Kineococcus gypseus TaxID=1637102 RepID=UPI003D7D9E42